MKNKAWLVMITVFLTGVIFSAGNFKIPPTMITILKEMHVGVAMGGWLVSMGPLAGIILALPAGGIMMNTGPKKLGMFSLFCALIGNVIGAMAPNFAMLMLGRLIEGVGFGLIGVVAPAIITVWFPPEKRGLPMAIWSVWMGVGLMFIFNVTNAVLPAFGWRGDWWLMVILFTVILVMFAWLVQVPEYETKATEQEVSVSEPMPMSEGFKSPASWLLGIIFASYSFGVGALTAFVPTFLVQVAGMDLSKANMYSSIVMLGMIVGGIVMGFVLNIVKQRNMLLFVSMILSAIFMCLTFKVTSPSLIMPFMIVIGLIYSMVPAIIFTIAPEAAYSPATIGITMGIAMLGQNLGGFVSAALIGAIVEHSGGVWGVTTMPLVIAAITGIVATVLYIKIKKRQGGNGDKPNSIAYSV